jgi:hypothetical protein
VPENNIGKECRKLISLNFNILFPITDGTVWSAEEIISLQEEKQ